MAGHPDRLVKVGALSEQVNPPSGQLGGAMVGIAPDIVERGHDPPLFGVTMLMVLPFLKHRKVTTMPTSHAANLLPFLSFIGKVAPTSILDVGVGNGKMGFLARESLDVMHRPDTWKLTLDGIEVFPTISGIINEATTTTSTWGTPTRSSTRWEATT